MNIKIISISIFITFVVTFVPESIIAQTDSTKIKYDAFVQEKKAKAKDKYTYSQYAIALRYKDTLNLNNTQIDQMYIEIKNLKIRKNEHYVAHKESLDTRGDESERMTQLLTGNQYDLLLRLKNHTKAKSNAENDWKEIELRDMHDELSKSETIEELYEYYIVRESLYDKYRHDPITQSAETRSHYINNRPIVLKALIKARKSNLNDTMGGNFDGGN